MTRQLEEFLNQLDELAILQTCWPIQEENGFDEWMVISELTENLLETIGKFWS